MENAESKTNAMHTHQLRHSKLSIRNYNDELIAASTPRYLPNSVVDGGEPQARICSYELYGHVPPMAPIAGWDNWPAMNRHHSRIAGGLRR